jgi:glycosyltransferase involved in cell wall biosynthesis
LFVEPQDEHAYRGKFNIEVLPENDRGLAYVRNYILQYARDNGVDWFVMSDDDIDAFGRIINKKTKRSDSSVLLEAYEIAKRCDFALTGFAYQQFAWDISKPMSLNTTFPDCCVIMQTRKCTFDFRTDLQLKVDRDYAMQAIRARAGVAVINRLCVSVPELGTNKGGLNEAYQQTQEIKAELQRFVELWPKYTRIVRRKGRFDLKLDLAQLARDTGQQAI